MEQKSFIEQEGKDWLISLLKNEVVKVNFQKLDGTDRLMTCTLKQDLIPEEHTPKGKRTNHSSDSLAVFDVESNGWRSFRFDSVKEVTFNIYVV